MQGPATAALLKGDEAALLCGHKWLRSPMTKDPDLFLLNLTHTTVCPRPYHVYMQGRLDLA
jgi:hypothetical protein